MSLPRRVLFLCTGNSCRSQMAEAIVNSRYPEWQASSAGVRPSESVHPLAIRALREAGIEHAGVPKPITQFQDQVFDLVVTLCDDANEECPIWLGRGSQVHEAFRDPASAHGTEEERLAFFRTIRDEIDASLPRLLRSLQ